jgi:serine/threonine protein kinase
MNQTLRGPSPVRLTVRLRWCTNQVMAGGSRPTLLNSPRSRNPSAPRLNWTCGPLGRSYTLWCVPTWGQLQDTIMRTSNFADTESTANICTTKYLLIHQCTGHPLFNAANNDTLDQSGLEKLGCWRDGVLRERVAAIRHRFARHLVSRLLQWDPKKRFSVEQALDHPFFQPTQPQPIGRLPGESPPWDVFLS